MLDPPRTLDFLVRLGLNFHPMDEFGGNGGAIGPPTFFLSQTDRNVKLKSRLSRIAVRRRN